MGRLVIVAISFLLFTSNVIAGPVGNSNAEGTIHIGVNLGISSILGEPFGSGLYGGYTFLGAGTFSEVALEKLSFAVEAESVNLGQIKLSSLQTHKASALGASLVATLPLDSDYSLVVKAGISKISHTINCSPKGCGNRETIGVNYGVSGLYVVTPKASLRAGLDYYPDGYKLISAGVLYRY